MSWLAGTGVAEEEKRNLKAVALELFDIRRKIDALAEALVKLSDKDFKRMFNASQDGILNEVQVDCYHEKLEKQLDIAKKEF